MNARMPKEEMALMMPASLSGAAWTPSYADTQNAPVSLLQRVGNAAKWLMELPRRRMLLDELRTLTDHELADIGLSRAELGRVFDPAFVAQRDADRGLSARR